MASPREGGRGGAAVRDMSAGGASGLEGRERTQGALNRSLQQSWAFPLALYFGEIQMAKLACRVANELFLYG